jgi:hypothetical protein
MQQSGLRSKPRATANPQPVYPKIFPGALAAICNDAYFSKACVLNPGKPHPLVRSKRLHKIIAIA